MVAFPGDRAGQDMAGVWMMSALLIWGPPEALCVAVLVGGLWTQFVDSHWGGSHRHPAQQVLNVAAIFVAIDLAFFVIDLVGPRHYAVDQILGVLVYLTVNACVVFGVVRIARAGGIAREPAQLEHPGHAADRGHAEHRHRSRVADRAGRRGAARPGP